MSNKPDNPRWGYATQGIRASEPESAYGEHSASIALTSSFTHESAAQAARVFAGEEPGYIYSRFTNPTVRAFEQRLALMEGGAACVATASGMSAILSLCLALLKSGDHVLASRGLFGATINLYNNILSKFGIAVSWVDMTDVAAWERTFQPNTKLLFVETPSNPLAEIADICALANLAHARGAWLCVDNC
ncbi:MAG TPA: aminotransferase class I/II-fold pyridoxal phosphate-dependent enzyme, partial [Nevskiaceae bacterium]|nr:aminotransferase class I/II-fold pyridoxal phosphate-dependent enzyme [Nevskiaceae bacterium]